MSPQCRPVLLSTWTVLTLCVVWKRSLSWSTVQSWSFLTPEWVVQVLRWSPRTSSWNFLQPQDANGFSTMTGIWTSMVMTKKVWQRPVDQVSPLRWVLIRHSQLIGFNKRIRLGVSSSWDSRSLISVRSTESSTVDPTVTQSCEGMTVTTVLGGRTLIPHKGGLKVVKETVTTHNLSWFVSIDTLLFIINR
jgi:hypothetical protein